MLWEKKSLKTPEKRGYLYIRETIYVRNKRSFIRKPKKLGSGKAYLERGKYSKKKDTYCGRIIELVPKHYLGFETFIETQGKKYLEYKISIKFNELIDDFVKYLLFIHEISEEEFNSFPKKAYEIAGGYLCKETLKMIKNFTVRHGEDNKKELERFAFRCEDAGIFDTEIIATLYTKIMPESKEDIKGELDELKKSKLPKKEFKNYREFVRKQYD